MKIPRICPKFSNNTFQTQNPSNTDSYATHLCIECLCTLATTPALKAGVTVAAARKATIGTERRAIEVVNEIGDIVMAVE